MQGIQPSADFLMMGGLQFGPNFLTNSKSLWNLRPFDREKGNELLMIKSAIAMFDTWKALAVISFPCKYSLI